MSRAHAQKSCGMLLSEVTNRAVRNENVQQTNILKCLELHVVLVFRLVLPVREQALKPSSNAAKAHTRTEQSFHAVRQSAGLPFLLTETSAEPRTV